MELTRLKYFVSVVEEGSFTKAAKKAHVAQSGVSAQIRQLERELGGGPLLDRSGRNVRPTAIGKVVLPHARAALAAVRAAKLAADEITGLVRGHVVVGSIGSRRVNLAALLAGFHSEHPDVDITLAEADSESLEERLLAGSMDAAIVSPGLDPCEGLDYHLLVDDVIVAAIPVDDPSLGVANTGIDELRDCPIVSLQAGAGTRARFVAACRKAGFTPNIRFEASDPVAVAELALHGLGVAILPAAFAASVDGLRTLTINRPALRAQVALASRASAPSSPAARALIAHVQAEYQQAHIYELG